MKKVIVFLDTNTLVSGIFFSGLESKLLKLPLNFITSDVNVAEIKEVTKRKFKKLRIKILDAALKEIDNALTDVEIIEKSIWQEKLDRAKKYISTGNDQKILAAVLASKPDYFVTGDKQFFNPEIRKLVNVVSTKELIENLDIE